jgi:pimeloyl-ACP methyl ester carboxylesterase
MDTAKARVPEFRIVREARGRVPGDGVELAFGFWPGRGSTVVAIHGLTASYMNFIGIAEHLAGRRALLALDLRGRGDSDKPEKPYGMVQHARDVASAMRALGLGPSVIVGHSMGAYVATALAATEPGLVSGLVFLDGGYFADLPVGVDPNQLLDLMLTDRISQLRNTHPSRESYKAFWHEQPTFPKHERASWTEAFLDYEVEEVAGGVRPKASETGVRADFAEMTRKADIEARLKLIDVPVLVIRAESGLVPGQPQIISDSVMEGIRACVSNVEELTVRQTTHYTIALGDYGASRVADLIVEFAAKVEGQ